MATLNWSTITVPGPETYDDKYQTRNQEAFYAAMLRILGQMKSLDFQISDVTNVEINTGNITIDLTGVEQAIRDLQFNNVQIEIDGQKLRLYGKRVEEA